MFLPIESKSTCVAGWLAATAAVDNQRHHEAYNVVIDVTDPLAQTAVDIRIMEIVDNFLRTHGALPLQAVANTIFPEQLYRRYGSPKFYGVYENIYKKIRKNQGDWGRYFERMIRRPSAEGRIIRPLPDLITKMKQHVHGNGRTFHNVYELVLADPVYEIAIYNPEQDAGRVMNRQCLSFLSFKLDHANRLMLTAIYRNHYYIQRLLGNLLGLARLMKFICDEVNIDIGSLTVVSTHAQVDTSNGYKRKDVSDLLSKCSEAACEFA